MCAKTEERNEVQALRYNSSVANYYTGSFGAEVESGLTWSQMDTSTDVSADSDIQPSVRRIRL